MCVKSLDANSLNYFIFTALKHNILVRNMKHINAPHKIKFLQWNYIILI